MVVGGRVGAGTSVGVSVGASVGVGLVQAQGCWQSGQPMAVDT